MCSRATPTPQPEKAQNSAAYLELNGDIPVAIIDDTERLPAGLRFDIRPEGPEVDGLIGAGVFGRTRVEVDYVSAQHRAIFSCETETALRTSAGPSARCPRLPDRDARQSASASPLHALAPTCDTSLCQ